MGRVIDTLNNTMGEIQKTSELILDEQYMMAIFEEYLREISPFKFYWDDLFSKRQMSVITWKLGANVVHYARLLKQLFSPNRPADLKMGQRVIELARTAANAICTELQDEKKATYKYLLISGSEYSWNHCGEEKKKALLGNSATNDEAESTLGGTTANIQRFGRIALSSAGAVIDMKRNAFLKQDAIVTKKNPSTNPSGLFHQFPHELQEVIVRVAMKDAPATRLRNNEDLALQAKARCVKEEMIKKNMEKATEEYIEGMYYRKMYDSAACWKGNVRVIDHQLKKLTSDTAQYDALKENIMMRVKGLGWDWCKHAWSKNG